MTALEADLYTACAQSAIVGTSACFTGCVAIGSLDYDAPAASLRLQDEPKSRTMAGLYHWLLVTHCSSQTTELLIHPDCPAAEDCSSADHSGWRARAAAVARALGS